MFKVAMLFLLSRKCRENAEYVRALSTISDGLKKDVALRFSKEKLNYQYQKFKLVLYFKINL